MKLEVQEIYLFIYERKKGEAGRHRQENPSGYSKGLTPVQGESRKEYRVGRISDYNTTLRKSHLA